MLGERNDLQTPYGQRSFAILLFQDLSVVPLLAILPLLASGAAAEHGSLLDRLLAVGEAMLGIAAVVLIGRYGLNPFFRILARSGAREVMTASALLVVLGAALLMQEVGLSMAMGAFLAGLLLAESNFRHQLEADIEPFRGMLLGLFFMSVGMSIDLALVREQWLLLAVAAPAVVLGKTMLIAVLSKLFGASWRDGLRSGTLLCTAGEFAFVLLPVAMALGLMSPAEAQPRHRARRHHHAAGADSLDGCREVSEQSPRERGAAGARMRCRAMSGELESRVLVIGFGRFGQIVNQVLLAQGIQATVIDKDVERIRDAGRFGLQVYYGDGTRLDVLRAAGAEKAEMICICIDDQEAMTEDHRDHSRELPERPQLRACLRPHPRDRADESRRGLSDPRSRSNPPSSSDARPSRNSEPIPKPLQLPPTTCASATSPVSFCRRKSAPWAVPSSWWAPRSRPSRSPFPTGARKSALARDARHPRRRRFVMDASPSAKEAAGRDRRRRASWSAPPCATFSS